MTTILFTREGHDKEATALFPDATILCEPMLSLASLEAPAPIQNPAAIVVTSANAIDHAAWPVAWLALPLYAVGEQTAARAREKGFATIITGDGTVETLEPLLAVSPRPLLYARGADITKDLASACGAVDWIVYRADPVMKLSENIRSQLARRSIDIVVLTSPRAAENFINLLRREGLADASISITLLCLSERVVESASGLTWRGVHRAATPSRAGIFETLAVLTAA